MHKVLLVDDDADLRRRVKTYAKNDWFICVEATSGDAALEELSQSHCDIIDGKEIILRPKEFDLLKYLAVHNHIALSREQLLKAVWAYEYYGDLRTVDTHIKSLREHLQNCRDYIVTVLSIGYKFEYKD
ncbi:MAG: DNA-binding response regulator [Treponema sp.]|jgi:DNA-binding response OmpR family regulator|nr:DNA-binding response regulator [Treponema sp.]